MPATPLKSYMAELSKYMDAFASAAGKPQRLAVVGDRVYWTQGKQQELFSAPVDAAAGEATRVIASEAPKGDGAEEKLTKEEEMLRERLRSRTTGISSFRVREADGAVFYTSGVDVYVYYQSGPRAGRAPLKIFDHLSSEDKAHFHAMGGKPNLFVEPVKSHDPARPTDHSVVTFVNNNNVYRATITEHPDSDTAPLSLAVQQITHIGDDLHHCGVADFIMQEEFSRNTALCTTDRYALFSYTDSSQMRSVSLLKSLGSPEVPAEEPAKPSYEKDVEEMPYSRVGDPNARTALVVYDTVAQQMRLLPDAAIRNVAPWTEYILRFGFKDAETIYFTVVDLQQNSYAILSCPVASLPVIGKEEDLRALYQDADSKTVANIVGGAAIPDLHVEWEQCIEFAWVACFRGAPIHFGEHYDVLCRHAAETATAHYHLYARPSKATGADAWQPLTAGEWNVRPGQQQVDGGRVYFLANAEGRLKQTLYAAPLDLAQAPHTAATLTRLTPLDEHVYGYCVRGDHLFYVSSTPTTPARLYAAAVSAPAQRREVCVPSWVPPVDGADAAAAATADTAHHFAGMPIVTPHVVTVTSRRGVPLSAAVFVSPTAPKNAPGPLALLIYGGPRMQLVYDDDYESACNAQAQVLLRHGVSVAVVDNQMSNANGLRDMAICKKNMDCFSTDDYVDVTRYLCTAMPSESGLPESFKVDAKRVGISGWSFGGYATLLAMCQAADVFKVGFAGAPVGDFRLYDSGYTCRYMGTLYVDDADGKRKVNEAYVRATIRHYAAGFPEECNRLYIAHGLLDECVHFGNSCHIVRALIDHAKPYNMIIYPGERHYLRQNRQSRLHHDALLVKTLEEQL